MTTKGLQSNRFRDHSHAFEYALAKLMEAEKEALGLSQKDPYDLRSARLLNVRSILELMEQLILQHDRRNGKQRYRELDLISDLYGYEDAFQ